MDMAIGEETTNITVIWVKYAWQNHETTMKTVILAKPIRKIPQVRPRLWRIDSINIYARWDESIDQLQERRWKKIVGEELI